MSNDPSDYGGDVPPPEPVNPYGYSPDVPPVRADDPLVKARVQGPAICLIVVGVLNLLLGLGAGLFGGVYAAIPEDMLEKEVQKQNPAALQQMKQAGMSIKDIVNFYVYGGFSGAALGVVTAVLAVIAGARMLALKSYGFAVFTSVLVSIPCISCSACCGIGEGIGIWSLVVLMNEEVKAAFR
jgi:hypothetical protein